MHNWYAAVHRGDAAAWEEIVQRFHRRIYNICYRFAGSAEDAQDLTQEVFIKVYRTVGSFDGEKASFNTWLTTVTRNLLVDHFRKTRNDRATDSMDAAQSGEEDGPTLAERLASDSSQPAGSRGEPRAAGDGASGAAADFAGFARGGDSARSAGYGLPRR